MSDALYCQCCERPLKEDKAVWLELDQRDWTYHDRRDVPVEYSQGWFAFGATCAKKIARKQRVTA